MLWSYLYLRGTEEIVKNFCRIWCIASLIGLSPILAVAVLRVNALSPLLTSLAGSSPALVLRVSWDGPTPFCFGIVFTYWSAVLHCSFFRFRLTAGRTAIIHHKPVRLFCRCMCSSYFSEYGCPGRWLWQWRLLATGPALAVIPGPHLYILNTIFFAFQGSLVAEISSLPAPPALWFLFCYLFMRFLLF